MTVTGVACALLLGCSERYDALVMRLMVVAVKASVAAEELEKTLQCARSNAGRITCGCKPGRWLAAAMAACLLHNARLPGKLLSLVKATAAL